MLKKTVLMMLFVVSSLLAGEIQWEKDFKSGVENATAQNKPILFVFSRHTCHYCKVLEDTTFKDERVIKKLNKEFISIVSYTDENDYTPRELWRPGTPTLWFLKPNGEARYEPLMGAVDAENFLKALEIVKEDFDESQKKLNN
jgi:thioredoxin-related protein